MLLNMDVVLESANINNCALSIFLCSLLHRYNITTFSFCLIYSFKSHRTLLKLPNILPFSSSSHSLHPKRLIRCFAIHHHRHQQISDANTHLISPLLLPIRKNPIDFVHNVKVLDFPFLVCFASPSMILSTPAPLTCASFYGHGLTSDLSRLLHLENMLLPVPEFE